MARNISWFEGRKFIWDGKAYESEEAARQAGQAYEKAGFELRLVSEEGKAYLYTRRAAAPAAAEG